MSNVKVFYFGWEDPFMSNIKLVLLLYIHIKYSTIVICLIYIYSLVKLSYGSDKSDYINIKHCSATYIATG